MSIDNKDYSDSEDFYTGGKGDKYIKLTETDFIDTPFLKVRVQLGEIFASDEGEIMIEWDEIFMSIMLSLNGTYIQDSSDTWEGWSEEHKCYMRQKTPIYTNLHAMRIINILTIDSTILTNVKNQIIQSTDITELEFINEQSNNKTIKLVSEPIKKKSNIASKKSIELLQEQSNNPTIKLVTEPIKKKSTIRSKKSIKLLQEQSNNPTIKLVTEPIKKKSTKVVTKQKISTIEPEFDNNTKLIKKSPIKNKLNDTTIKKSKVNIQLTSQQHEILNHVCKVIKPHVTVDEYNKIYQSFHTNNIF